MTNTYLKASDRGTSLLGSWAAGRSGAAAAAAIYVDRQSRGAEAAQPHPDALEGTLGGCQAGPSAAPTAPGGHAAAAPKRRLDLLCWRSSVAAARNIFPHSVLPEALLERICSASAAASSAAGRPLPEVEAIRELLGPSRGRLYAEQVLEVLRHGFAEPDAHPSAAAAIETGCRSRSRRGIGGVGCAAAGLDGHESAAVGNGSGKQQLSTVGTSRPGGRSTTAMAMQPEVIEVVSSGSDGEDSLARRKRFKK